MQTKPVAFLTAKCSARTHCVGEVSGSRLNQPNSPHHPLPSLTEIRSRCTGSDKSHIIHFPKFFTTLWLLSAEGQPCTPLPAGDFPLVKVQAAHANSWHPTDPFGEGFPSLQECRTLPLALYLNLTNISGCLLLLTIKWDSRSHPKSPRNCTASFLTDLKGDKALLSSSNEFSQLFLVRGALTSEQLTLCYPSQKSCKDHLFLSQI